MTNSNIETLPLENYDHLGLLFRAMRALQKDRGATDEQMYLALCQVEAGDAAFEAPWGSFLQEAREREQREYVEWCSQSRG